MKELLEKIATLRLLVVGDIILDHYVWGDATRISPEAPVPVVAVDRDSHALGGAANVALNARVLGARATLFGSIGEDEAGARLRTILREAEVDLEASAPREGRPTIVKTRVIVRNQQLCRLDRENPPRDYALDPGSASGRLAELVDGMDAVIISDYAKGVVSGPVIEGLREAARRTGGFIAYDPKPKGGLEHRDLDLITPNRQESLELAGLTLPPHEPFPAEDVARLIHQRHSPRRLIITLGGEGMLLCEGGRVLKRIPAYAREVFDVSGAGDTSITCLALALAAGASMEDAAHFANTAAGVVVGKLGTATATPEEILRYDEQRRGRGEG